MNGFNWNLLKQCARQEEHRRRRMIVSGLSIGFDRWPFVGACVYTTERLINIIPTNITCDYMCEDMQASVTFITDMSPRSGERCTQ